MTRIEFEQAIHVESFESAQRADGVVSVTGRVVFDEALVGPPGRVHGGFHPLVRTVPILERLGVALAGRRIAVEAELGAPLSLGEPVAFEGQLEHGADHDVLTTRFAGTPRLDARATVGGAASFDVDAVGARFAALWETQAAEEGYGMKVVSVPYRIAPSAVSTTLRRGDPALEGSHVARCCEPDGGFGLLALCTQLDAIGATGRGAAMRHPHFTRWLSLAFEPLESSGGGTLILIADRTTLVEDSRPDAPTVTIADVAYRAATVEVAALLLEPPRPPRAVAYGRVTAHPVDPSRFAGFEGMRKLKST